MKKMKYLQAFVIAIFFTGFTASAPAQSQPGQKTRVLLGDFTPISSEVRNSDFEALLPHLIQMGLFNQKTIEWVDPNSVSLNSGKGKSQKNVQSVYRNASPEITGQVDMILYGDYSFTNKELYIVPKIFDLSNNKNYTLQSLRISDFEKGIKLARFDELIGQYWEKINSLGKEGQNLLKVGIIWKAGTPEELTSTEITLFRSFIIELSKVLDTNRFVSIVKWETMQPYYNTNEELAGVSKETKADMIYQLDVLPLNDVESTISLTLYDAENAMEYKGYSFEYNLWDDNPLVNDLAYDFNTLFKDTYTGEGFDLKLLNITMNDPAQLEDKGYEYYVDTKHYLSNLYYRKAFETQKDDYFNAYETYMQGENFYSLNQRKRALNFFSRALIYKSDYHFAWWGIGWTKYEQGDYTGATDAFMEVEKVKPDYEPGALQYNIGLSAYGSEQYPLALEYFQKAIDSSYSKPDDAYYYLALTFEAISDFRGGVDYFEKELVNNPDNHYNRVYLAYFYYKAGEDALYDYDFQASYDYMNKAESLYINQLDRDEYTYSLIGDYNYYKLLACLYLDKYDEAFTLTEEGIESGDFDPATRYLENANELTYVTNDDNVSRYREIIRYYKLHTEVNPSDTAISDVYNSIGYYYSLLGDINEAAGWFEKALETDRENLTAQMNMMELYLVLKNYRNVREKAETIQNSARMRGELENNSGNRAMFYFLLYSEQVANGEDFRDSKEKFTEALNEDDFITSWDFSLYTDWMDGLKREKKTMLNESYQMLTARIAAVSGQ